MKKLLLLSALVLLSSSWTFAQSEQASAEPPGGMSEIQAYSIFYENYKSDSYEEAIKFGRWMWQSMPETIEGYSRFDLKRNLGRLVTAYNEVAQKEDDPSLQEAYVDTALMIYDKAFDKFSDDDEAKFGWYINRGRLLHTHSDIVDNASIKAAEDYYEAFKLNPEKLVERGDGYYIQRLLKDFADEGRKDEALQVIQDAEQFASDKLLDSFSEIRGDLFDSPEERIEFLEGELEDNPEDEEILTQLRDVYEGEDMSSEAREVGEKLYELNPTFDNIMAVAEAAQSNANYNNAIKYYKEALDKAEDDAQKGEIALEISDAYLNKDEVQEARDFARQAIDFRGDWGAPYIQIADVYARTVNNCTDEEDRDLTPEDKAVYWLVLDYLDKAKEVDSDAANEVERKYESYEPVIPSKSEKFFWKPPLEEGEEFAVDSSLMECYAWIDETTTVR
ncbi:MAG: tetratricopeptide repeat protein [Bacteroidota bacterium]